MTEKFEKLVAANIQLLPIPEIRRIRFRARRIHRACRTVQGRFGRIGTAGLLTEKGIAPL